MLYPHVIASLFGRRNLKNRTSSKLRAVVDHLEQRTLLSTTWYVATTGSNANPGSLAAPFQTIQQAANVAKPGDTVLIEGGVYHETVTMPGGGTSSQHIVFQNYNNQSVTIDGADPLTGWTNSSGNVWTAPDSTDLGFGFNQIFVDGVAMNDARWPNTGLDLSHPTMETIPSVTSTATSATISDPALTQAANFWVGGTIHLGAGQDWVGQTGTITASGPGFVTFNYVLHDPMWTVPTAGNQYYLFGVPGALDAPGEFFVGSGQASLYTPLGDSPNNHVVEVKTRQYGFNLSNAPYVRIQGLHFFACSILTNSKSTNVVLDQITAQYISQFEIFANGFNQPQTGIVLAGNNDVLENSVIVDSAGDGVYMTGTGAYVNNNLFHDIDYAGVDCAPIRIGGYFETITHNTIYNTGRNGILFSGFHDYIAYNDVSKYGLQCTDLGGFYTASISGNGTTIAYNKFHDATTGGFGAGGIMFDNSSSGFIIHHNITWNVNAALKINGDTHNMQIYCNTFDAISLSIYKDGLIDDWTGTILEDNILTHPIEFGLNVQLIDNISNHHQFVDAANGNFTLLPGAPAVDTGMIIAPYTNGYVGKAPDVGALELGLTPFVVGANLASLPADPSA